MNHLDLSAANRLRGTAEIHDGEREAFYLKMNALSVVKSTESGSRPKKTGKGSGRLISVLTWSMSNRDESMQKASSKSS